MISSCLNKSFSTSFNLSRLKALRLELHNSPEVGFKEYNTSKILKKYLTEILNINSNQFQEICGETGFIVTIKGQGQKQKLEGPKTLMFRTDIDALNIGGRQAKHLCGHDGHMASIMAFAELLQDVLFQPAEESVKMNGVYYGGADRIVQEGGLLGVDEIYGYHNWPCRPFGKCLIQPGYFLPAIFVTDFQIIGKGGHGSVPEKCLDPIEPMIEILAKQKELKQYFAKENKKFRWSTGIASAGTTANIIPDTAQIAGTIRVFDQDLSIRIKNRFEAEAKSICEKYKCQLKGGVQQYGPAVFNYDVQTEIMKIAAKRVLGQNGVGEENELNVIGEDFAFYLQKVPGAFGLISSGTGAPGFTHLHQSDFKFNDDLIEVVAKIYLEIAKQRLIE